MKITFLIGNGFDIGLGMRSQFSDFFPYYIQNSKDKKSTLKELSEEIDSHRQEWSYFEKQLGQYTLHFKIDSENHQEVIRKFVEQFQDFEKEFIEYLEKEEDKLTFDNEEFISTVMMNALLNFYSVTNLPIKSSRSIEDTFKALNPNRITFSFLTYNYTNALENCLQTISEKSIQFNIGKDIPCEIGKLVHVHGQKMHFPLWVSMISARLRIKSLLGIKDLRVIL